MTHFTTTQSIPKITKQWIVDGQNGLDSLKYTEGPIPDLGDTQVLVKIHAVSLNYRDLIIPQGKYPWPVKPGVVPGSDGAGIVLAVGKNVTRFQPGDKVVTMLNQLHIAGPVTNQSNKHGLGGSVDGTLRTIGAFDEQGLVPVPECLTYIEAATLPCAGLTAWNALFGLSGKAVTAGQYVLTQGTGGVSIFALQFAKAVGARVIATTSSNEKALFLQRLGADHVINYRETPDWGSRVKQLTPGGVGVDLVVEVAGPTTLKQSAASVKLDGTISVVGFVGGESKETMPSLLDTWINLFTARGLWVGSRLQMEDMCRAIEANPDRLHPVVDPRVFKLSQVKEAYEYLASGKHQGKVCVEIEH
ncbi:putative alcohol dehydrogenase [Talaromyces proteolyticus]|uniref:Alcohol dehydrogenase n=1 Tax=Talaromyces proteolyticus TaxID=1131652 RepID=A0AAD4Q120_9EURO|nr:putative alcohol dehydrogenase [Talaromyces proteolyticus]KAH8701809.1 putative alcohol dehydrogenase [Talaromyces proteolyticus]